MKIHIGKSKTHGQGILALRNIKKGEVLFIIKGKRVNFLIDNIKKANAIDYDLIGHNKNTWIDPVGFASYVNHSCEPNSGIKGRVTVVALRNIKKGEEVTIDYSLSESDIFWGFKCSCNAKQCRRKVESIQFFPIERLKKHGHFTPIYFKKILQRFHVSKFKNRKELERAWVHFIKSEE